MHAALLATLLSMPATAATAEKGEPAPEVQGFTVSHGPTRLAEYKDEIVLVNFWATWCPPCMDDLDKLAEADAALRAEGIRIVTVNVDQKHELESVEKLAESRGWQFPIVLDPNRRTLSRYFSKRSVPVTALIDTDRTLKELHLSWDKGDVEQILEEARELRAENPVPKAAVPAEGAAPAEGGAPAEGAAQAEGTAPADAPPAP